MSASTTCVLCNRPLKDANSIARGMGAVCCGKASRQDSGALLNDTPVLNGVGTLADVGLVCRRLADGRLACNVPHVVVYHSPTGFECGYAGGGPAELALNVLHALMPHRVAPRGRERGLTVIGDVLVSDEAFRLHQQFKVDFIAPMDVDGGFVPIEDINAWIATKLIEAERDAQ